MLYSTSSPFLPSCFLSPGSFSVSFLTTPLDSKLFCGSWAKFTQSCKWLSPGLSSEITFVTSVTRWQLSLLSYRSPCHSEFAPAILLSAPYLFQNDRCLSHLLKLSNNPFIWKIECSKKWKLEVTTSLLISTLPSYSFPNSQAIFKSKFLGIIPLFLLLKSKA